MLNEETFRNPSSEYRPLPFWFWNSKLRKPEIEAQIRDFADKGLGGFFIHARFGLETEYLSREWMDCVKFAVETAAGLGLEVWLYDENGFPSGIGDLKVSRIRDYRSRFVDLTEKQVGDEEEVELTLPQGGALLAYARPLGRPAWERIDLAASVSGDRLRWKAPKGEWNVEVYSECVLDDPNDVIFGVNYLNPEAMRYFLDLTLDPYETALGEHFGKTIKGIFTDEPTLLPWHHNISWYAQRPHGRVVVWDSRIEREMRSRADLPTRDFLPHLFFDIDDNTPQIRKAFRQVVADLYVRAFFEPYSKWCEEHGLKLTGHVLFEEGLYLNTEFQADITEPLSRLHIPGTDHLGEATEAQYGGHSNLPQQLTNLQGEKLVASIAHYMGRGAVISETYGCAGWGLSFEKMKWIADWQYSLGISMLCPHAMFYSIEGFRKSDAPPSENHMSGWPHYRLFADYIGRLSYVLRAGRHVAKVALFYPLRQFWGEYAVGKVGEKDQVTSDAYDLCASILQRLHFDYDILSEQALSGAMVRNGRLVVRDEEYEVLIAPPFAMEDKALEVVKEFLKSGGKWILTPTLKGEPEREQIEREIALVRHSMGNEAADRIAPEIERQWPMRPRHIALQTGDNGTLIAMLAGISDHEGIARALDGALREAITPDIEIRSGMGDALPDVRYVHREVDEKEVFFIANASGESVRAEIRTESVGSVQVWNPETGTVGKSPSAELIEGHVHIRCDLPPYGSTIYVIDTERPVQSRPFPKMERRELMVFSDEWQFEILSPNALVLEKWEFSLRTHGFGSQYEYATSFRSEFIPEKLMLMLDDIEYRSSLMGGTDMTVQVNGRSWDKPEMGWYLDNGFKTLDIAEAVREGENTVRIVIRHSAWSGQPHLLNSPPVLLGNFACDSQDRTLLRPVRSAQSGSWTEFGYPFYSGTAAYSQSFRVPQGIEDHRVVLAVDSVRDMVEIVVNGQTADVRLWQPWEADITDLLREGDNALSLKVTNSAANFMEAEPRPSGLIGKVRLFAEAGTDRRIGASDKGMLG